MASCPHSTLESKATIYQKMSVPMTTRYATALLSFLLISCTAVKPPTLSVSGALTTTQFRNQADLDHYIESVREIYAYRKANAPKPSDDDEERIEVTGSRIAASDVGITNNQITGVDEGDIVKLSGDYLLMLRRGKLSSIAIQNGGVDTLVHVDTVNAFPDFWRYDTWYDEMLVVENTVLVLGYNYDLGASEIHRLKLEPTGKLVYLDGHLFKSGDYYDSENYAARIKSGKLVFYMPTPLLQWSWNGTDNESIGWPKTIKISDRSMNWRDWIDVVKPSEVFKPVRPALDPTLHTFVSCSVTSPELSCNGVSFISETRAEYFVSNDHIYLWSRNWQERDLLDYKFSSYGRTDELPIRGAANQRTIDASICQVDLSKVSIGCIGVNGVPRNQFSFHVDTDYLYAALDYELGHDDRHYMGLYKIPVSAFGQASNIIHMPFARLPDLPDPINIRFQNRYLFSGSQSYYNEPIAPVTTVFATSLEDGQSSAIQLTHSVDRLELIDEHVFVSGLNGNRNLAYSILEKDGFWSKLASRTMHGAVEDESRSHAFNFHQFKRGVRLLGFTTTSLEKADIEADYYGTAEIPADISFVGYDQTGFTFDSGKLVSSSTPDSMKSKCQVSCVDWYGNSRPFFVGDRIFGLTGDELIEAKLSGRKVSEIRRITFQ